MTPQLVVHAQVYVWLHDCTHFNSGRIQQKGTHYGLEKVRALRLVVHLHTRVFSCETARVSTVVDFYPSLGRLTTGLQWHVCVPAWLHTSTNWSLWVYRRQRHFDWSYAICTCFNNGRFLSNKRGTHYGSAEGNNTMTSCTMHTYTHVCVTVQLHTFQQG